jgi:nucleoside-diphosphate-sugar epimerase
MPTVMFVGGRGQCGRAIAERFVADGWDVTATTSGEAPDVVPTPEIHWVHLDRNLVNDLSTVVVSDTDVVVHVTAFDAGHGEQLLALGDRVGSVIALSTLSVYSDAQGHSLDQAKDEATFPAWPVPIPEDWITLPPGPATYSTRKVALGQTLLGNAPWPVTILRPGAIHGPHSRHLREWYFIKRVLDRREEVVLPYEGESIFQTTATVNLAGLVLLAAENPGNRTLNCGDLNPPSATQISATIDDLMGWTTEQVLVAGREPSPSVGNHPWKVPQPVISDMHAAQSELGYRELSNYRTAIAESLAWAIDACEGRDWREVFPNLAAYPHDLFDYDAEDAFLVDAGA